MTDILQNNQNSNELSTQQGRTIPNLNLKPSTYEPPNMPPAVAPTAPQAPQTSAPILETPSPEFLPPPERPMSKRATSSDLAPLPDLKPAPLATYETQFDIQPDGNTQFINEFSPFFKVPPQPDVYTPAPGNTPSRTDQESENILARLKGLTPEQIRNRQIDSALYNQQSLTANIGAKNFIPQPRKWEYENSNVNQNINALIEQGQALMAQDFRGREQFKLNELINRPFDIITAQFDNADIFQSPSSSELTAHRDSILESQMQATSMASPVGIPLDATGNALINEASGMSNLLDGIRMGGPESKRKEGEQTVWNSIFDVAKGAFKGLVDIGGAIITTPIAIANYVDQVSLNQQKGQKFDQASQNAFQQTVTSTWAGQQAADIYGRAFAGTPDGESQKRTDVNGFNPFAGKYRDYGNGSLGAAMYLMDLPGNLLSAGLYSATDAMGIDKRETGVKYTGNRFMDALTGRSYSFMQRRDDVAYLTPIRRDPNKTQTQAIGEWTTGFLMDGITGHFGSAALEGLNKLGIGGLRRAGINIGAQGTAETASKFASREVPQVIPTPSSTTTARPSITRMVNEQSNPLRLMPAKTERELANEARASASRALPPSKVIVTPPGKPNHLTVPTPQNVPVAQTATAYVFPSAGLVQPKPGSWSALNEAATNTRLITEALIQRNRANANKATVALTNEAIRNRAAANQVVAAGQEALNNKLGFTAAERINNLRGIPNYRPTSLGVASGSVPTAPIAITPVISPQQILERVNPFKAGITPTPGEMVPLKTVEQQANFVNRAINGGAFSAAQDGSLRMTPEVFAQNAAKRQVLQNQAGALTTTLNRNLPLTVRKETESAIARIQSELALIPEVKGNWQTLDTAAVRMADDAGMPITPVKPQQSEALTRIRTVQQQLDGLVDDAKKLSPDGSLEAILNGKTAQALEGSPAPLQLPGGTNTPMKGNAVQEALAPKLRALVDTAEKNNIDIQKLLKSRDLPNISNETIERVIGRKLTPPSSEELFKMVEEIPSIKNANAESKLMSGIPSTEELFNEATSLTAKRAQFSKDIPSYDDLFNEAAKPRKSAARLPVGIPSYKELFDEAAGIHNKIEPIWTRNPLDKKGQVVEIPMSQLDAAWSKGSRDLYINPDGTNAIAGRFDGIKNHLANNNELYMPTATIEKNGALTFTDGRHRTALMREQGAESIPVVIRNPKLISKLGIPEALPQAPVTPQMVQDALPVLKSADVATPVRPVEIQQATRRAKQATSIDVRDVASVRRTNAQISEIARSTVNPATGQPIWGKARAMSTKEVAQYAESHGDLLSRFGKPVDVEKIKAPIKRIEVEAADAVTGKPSTSFIQKKEPLPKDWEVQGKGTTTPESIDISTATRKELEDELDRIYNTEEAISTMSPRKQEAAYKQLDPYKSKVEQKVWELQELEDFKKVAPLELQQPKNTPSDPVFNSIQQEVATLETKMKEAGLAVKQLEQKIIEMKPFIQNDEELLSNIKHHGRGDIESEYLTQERFGLISPENNPNRIHMERVDIAGVNTKTIKPENILEPTRELTKEETKRTARAAKLSGETWYHGTKTDVNDLTVLDPRKGASFSELGSGIHFTNDAEQAKQYAKALIPENKVPTGDVRTDAIGSVFEANLVLGKTEDASQPINKRVGKAFNTYMKEQHPDWYMNGAKANKNTTYGSLLLEIRDAAQKVEGSVPVGESRMIQIQREFTQIMKDEGIDSLHLINKDGSKTVNVLDPTLISTSKKTPVGDGSLIEGLAARKYVDDVMADNFPDSLYTKANQTLSRHEFEVQIAKELDNQWKEAATEVEDLARQVGEKTSQLERRGIEIKNAAAEKILANSEDAPKTQLKQFMKDSNHLCL